MGQSKTWTDSSKLEEGTDSEWDRQKDREKNKAQNFDFNSPTKSPFLTSMSFTAMYTEPRLPDVGGNAVQTR